MRSATRPPIRAWTGRSRALPRMSQQAISRPEKAPITVGSGRWVKPEEKARRNMSSMFSGLSPAMWRPKTSRITATIASGPTAEA